MNVFPKIKNKAKSLLSPLTFINVPEVLVSTINQENEIKAIPIGKKERKNLYVSQQP